MEQDLTQLVTQTSITKMSIVLKKSRIDTLMDYLAAIESAEGLPPFRRKYLPICVFQLAGINQQLLP